MGKIMLGLLGLLVIVLAASAAPDLQRYMKIRSM
jgi:hypothetical protein